LLENGEWSENARRLLSIKSIGVVTAGWLLVATLNFTNCDTVEQLCSFAGLIPRQRQSGTSLNKRPTIGYAAHARLRQALFIATYSAVQHNPPIRLYYRRLQARGKAGKPALVAAARKLVLICWACVVNGREFDAGYGERWR
jgi:transposase